MPTSEEIEEYVDDALNEWCTKNFQIVEPWHCVVEDLSHIAADALVNISKDYCIVSKSKMKKKYALYKRGYAECGSAEIGCVMNALEDIFGKSLFEEK